MRRTRGRRLVGQANAILALLLVSCGGGAGPTAPSFDYGVDTPSDLRSLADAVMIEAASALPDRASCLDGVMIEGARELEDRARYDPDEATITIRVPATAAQLRVSLVHELAHHLEFTCDGHEPEVRPAFLAAQGYDSPASWFEGPTWEDTPSEQWATAVVRIVTDSGDPRAPIPLTDDALAVVANWGGAG